MIARVHGWRGWCIQVLGIRQAQAGFILRTLRVIHGESLDMYGKNTDLLFAGDGSYIH